MRRQQNDMKNSILSQVLTQEARARCNNNLIIT
jgi:DNA-binding TFAR19-related protein (PDSD5 family)